MDLVAENEELKRRLALAEDALRDRAALERASGASDDRYRTLFDSIDEGFCIIEVIGGGDGELSDYCFLEANASFERQTGLIDAVGRRMRELAPDHEEHWFERYSRIAQARVPERFEDRAEALGRWYDVYAFPIDDPKLRRVGILFRDIIERKRAEAAQRQNEGRQAFLLKLSDALQPLDDAGEIQATTSRLLGTHLGVDRAMYGEVTGEPGRETGVIRGQYACGCGAALATVSKQQHEAATGDAFGVFLIGVPMSSTFAGDKEGQVSVAKGKVQAIQSAMMSKRCNSSSAPTKPAPPKPAAPVPAAATKPKTV